MVTSYITYIKASHNLNPEDGDEIFNKILSDRQIQFGEGSHGNI